MSRMLNLIHAGWAAARAQARSGRPADALAQTKRLLARPDVPVSVAADAHRLAAELLIEAEGYATARRHLRAASGLVTGCARTHYLAGLAFERDPQGDDLRAARHFRKASVLEPENPLYRAAFGRAAVRCARVKRGVRELLAAAAAAPDSIAVVRVVVDGLIEAGRVRAARRVLIKAQFRHPRSADLQTLRNRVRFETARIEQERTQEARIATEGDVFVVPFVRITGATPRSGGRTPGTIRRDVLSLPRPHLPRLGASKADC